MNTICNCEHVHVKEKMSLVHFKVYIHLQCFQCYCKKALSWRLVFVYEVLTYTVKTKEPLVVQTLTANTYCCRFIVKFVFTNID